MSDALTPKALAEEIGIDAKVLRAYLRKEFTRSNEVKNTSWIIPAEAADAAREKFAKQEAKAPEAPAEA
jgi:predicted site-specific integrase-resolvase